MLSKSFGRRMRRRYPRLNHREKQQRMNAQRRHRVKIGWVLYNLRSLLRSYANRPTLSSLARALYKGTDAGVSMAAMLDTGPVWNGDRLMDDPSIIPRVTMLGISSIVEGTDAEVPLEWIDLSRKDGVKHFWHVVEDVNAEACRLWDEANGVEVCPYCGDDEDFCICDKDPQ